MALGQTNRSNKRGPLARHAGGTPGLPARPCGRVGVRCANSRALSCGRAPFYGRWDGRLALSARRLDGAAFDSATLTNIAVGATADGADEALDPALWLTDLTAPAPAVLVRDAPPPPADSLEELPVWVSYHFDPLGTRASSDTAALVAHAVVLAMREEFALRTQGAGAPPTGAARHIEELLAPLRQLPV